MKTTKYTFLRTSKKYVLCFLILCTIYSLLLILSFLIPQSAIEANRVSSIAFLDAEGLHPKPLYGNTSLDNFTDNGVILGLLAPFDESPVIHAFAIYGRYWNGWVPLVRPLLLLGDITVIRIIQSGVFFVLLCVSIIVIAKRTSTFYAILLLLALLPARLDLVAVSMQFSHIFWIIFVFLIWLCNKDHSNHLVILAFFTVGSVTNYIDLLTAPILTLVIPLIVAIIVQPADATSALSQRLLFSVKSSLAWGFGYGVTWIAKWILSTIVTRKNVVLNAVQQASLRTHGDIEFDSSITYSFPSTIHKCLSQFIYKGDVAVIFLVLIVFSLGYFFTKRHTQTTYSVNRINQQIASFVIPVLCTSFLPLLWIAFFTQHSFVHADFLVFRILCGSLFGIFSCAWVFIQYLQYKTTKLQSSTTKTDADITLNRNH